MARPLPCLSSDGLDVLDTLGRPLPVGADEASLHRSPAHRARIQRPGPQPHRFVGALTLKKLSS